MTFQATTTQAREERAVTMDQAVREHSEGESTGDATAKAPPSRRRWWWVAALAAAAVALAFIVRHRGGEAQTSQAAPGLRAESGALVGTAGMAELRYVDVAAAKLSDPVAPLPAPGRVTVAESSATPIMAPLSGRIDEVKVQLGDVVKPGDRLVAIRSAVLPELGREIETARAALAVKKASVARLRDLVALRAVPEKDLLLAEEELHEGEIALSSAEGKRRSFHLGAIDQNGLYWLEAPRAGTVVERHALVGMEVGPDRVEPLVSIAQLDEVVVIADLLEGDVAAVKPGQKAAVSAAPGVVLDGTVEYVAAVVDPQRRTVAVRVRVPNPRQELRPNAFAEVSFVDADRTQHVVVPSEAVVTDGQTSVVFVREERQPNRYRFLRRQVRTGRSRGGRTELLDGLAPGETYVTHGALLLLNALDLEG
jgi:cobalt-zinc-cadmium efflux system membrane fusion protein